MKDILLNVLGARLRVVFMCILSWNALQARAITEKLRRSFKASSKEQGEGAASAGHTAHGKAPSNGLQHAFQDISASESLDPAFLNVCVCS